MSDKNDNWIFLIPPFADCTMPMLGPFLLSSYLKKQNAKAKVFDTSIQLLHDIFKRDILQTIAKEQKLSEEEIHSLQKIASAFRQSTNDNFVKLSLATKVLSYLSKRIKFSIDEAVFPFSINDVRRLRKAVSLLKWLEYPFTCQPFWKYLSKNSDANIGISVSYSSQMPFAILLAELIKTNFHYVTLFLGGAYWSNYEISPRSVLKNFKVIDYIISGNGEPILHQLLSNGKPNREVLSSHCSDIIEYIPDFSGVQWEKYCLDNFHRAIPFSLRTSCYYKKCAFCNGDNSSGFKSVIESGCMVTVIDQLKKVCRKHSISSVYFTDAALSPKTLTSLSNCIKGDFKWGINTRIDPGFSLDFFKSLSKNGCEMLRIGMESYSSKVLKLMNKGIKANNFIPFFTQAFEAGIKLHVYIMFGFPGEDDNDREQTIDFLIKMKKMIYSYSISIFHAIPGTAIYDKLLHDFSIDTTDSSVDINKIYYTEESYKNICYYVSRAAGVLAETHSNRFCYSGRIFQDSPEPSSEQVFFSSPLDTEISYNIFKNMFSSGFITNQFKKGGAVCIDLINDSCFLFSHSSSENFSQKEKWGRPISSVEKIVIQNNFSSSSQE